MTVKTYYVIKSPSNEGLIDSRFRSTREHTLPQTTGVVWWSPTAESQDFLDNSRILWAFDNKDTATSFAMFAASRWPAADFIVVQSVEGFRSAATPPVKFSVSDKGVLPA